MRLLVAPCCVVFTLSACSSTPAVDTPASESDAALDAHGEDAPDADSSIEDAAIDTPDADASPHDAPPDSPADAADDASDGATPTVELFS